MKLNGYELDKRGNRIEEDININKYINQTRKKTKKAKLPVLSTLSPIMPDGAAGIANFNSSFGSNPGAGEGMAEEYLKEANMKLDKESLQKEIIDSTISYMEEDMGYDEDDSRAFTDFDFEQSVDSYKVEVRAELNYSSLQGLVDTLNPIIEKYDKNAYFDMETSGIITAYIFENSSLSESLARIDSYNFRKLSESYDLSQTYSLYENQLSAEDKSNLQKFISKTNDSKEIDTYIKGLISNESTNEDLDDNLWSSDTAVDLVDYYNQIVIAFSTLKQRFRDLSNVAEDNKDVQIDCKAALIDLNDFYEQNIKSIEDDLSPEEIEEEPDDNIDDEYISSAK